MFGRFELTITLGNEEMSELHHVADALYALACRFKVDRSLQEGTIRDLNGNTVGSFLLVEDREVSP